MNQTYALLQQRINLFLAQSIQSQPESYLRKAMSYSLLAGGKRIRPILVYLTGQMFGCKLDILDVPAAAIECIHTYSLIHDDLPAMDNDDLRRGKQTCHVKFDEAHAILAGDALQTLAFTLLTQAPYLSDRNKLDMIQVLSAASGCAGMCLGQSLDLQSEHKQISLTQLQKIHRNKTGKLIKSAIKIGSIASGECAKPYWQYLEHYADAIGLAFQVQDDILDVVGDQSIMGKRNGADQLLEKSTYPSKMGLDDAIKFTHDLQQQAINALDNIPYPCDGLRAIANFVVNRNN